MNARDNTPLRSKIAAHLDVVREADANAIGKAVGLSDRSSMVVNELNAMRTDGLIECEQRKKEMIYWLAVPVAQIDAESSSEAVSRTDRPDGIRAGTRAAQIWDALRDGAKLTAREIASMLQCANGAIDPVMSTLYKSGTVARTKGPDSVYRYHRPAAESSQVKAQAAPQISDDADPWRAPELQYLAEEDRAMPPADPALLAKANKMLSERLARVAHVLRGCGLPALAEIGCGEDLQMATAALSGAYQAQLAELDHERGVSSAACSSLAAVARHLCLPAEAGGHGPIIDAIEGFRGEHDETVRQFAVLKERHDSYEQAIADIHRACGDAGITEGHVAERVVKLAETVKTLRDTVHKITEGDEAVDVLQAASGFVVLASKRKPRRLKKPEIAREAALSAIRSGAQRATVFALVPVGEARRGAEWRDA